jgi:hypothetical protein
MASNFRASSFEERWTYLHISANVSKTSLLFCKLLYVGNLSYFSRTAVATLMRASSGQEKNQSMVQQLTSPGNFLHLILKESPIGLIDKITCSLSLTLYTKVR